MFDIAVLGGGPAGAAAACWASARGARVALFDEQAAPGGQVYRAPVFPQRSAEARRGNRLRARLEHSDAEVHSRARVWGLGGGPLVASGEPHAPFRVDAWTDDDVLSTVEARALILCPGAYERVVPFPGWTLPGVFGLAAATILLKAQGVLPGARVVVAGTGPLLAAVAAGILAKGGEVTAVVDAKSRAEWLRALPALASRPGLLARGAGWIGRLMRERVPVMSAHRLVQAHGTDRVGAVEVAPLRGGPATQIECDAVCVGHGLVPATESARLYGAHVAYRPERGGWVPVLDAAQRTTVARLYMAGDGAGIAGADAAPHTGEIAAASAMADLGSFSAAVPGASRAARAGAAMAAVMAPPPDLIDAIPPECIVCRCEDVTRAEIDEAAKLGATDLNQLKQFTRCGMGPCQGRMCGEAAAELLARRVGGREAAGLWTARLPLRPVPMSALLGDFVYADIPVPAPAPI